MNFGLGWCIIMKLHFYWHHWFCYWPDNVTSDFKKMFLKSSIHTLFHNRERNQKNPQKARDIFNSFINRSITKLQIAYHLKFINDKLQNCKYLATYSLIFAKPKSYIYASMKMEKFLLACYVCAYKYVQCRICSRWSGPLYSFGGQLWKINLLQRPKMGDDVIRRVILATEKRMLLFVSCHIWVIETKVGSIIIS